MLSTKRIRGETTSKTFVYMWIGAKHMLRLAMDSKDGQLYTCMSSMVLSAFMLEAYFNHLGQLRYKDWDKRERRYPKTKKFMMFAETARLTPAMDERPHSSLVRLFALRDGMAHGRTIKEEIDAEIDAEVSLANSIPSPEWQQLITVENVEKWLTDAVEIIRELHQALGHKDDPFATSGGGIYVADGGKV